jgi:RNA polymerase subunit RPABC4/transcription elongation factor Spt4
MLRITDLALSLLLVLPIAVAVPQATSLAPLDSPPEGFQLASSTRDNESLQQQGPCTACAGGIATIAGPPNIGPGVFTAAGGPSIFGPNNACPACGDCYEIQNTGKAFCPDCGGKTQSGPRNILVMITNQCRDCVPSATKGDFHFDILNAPQGWDNPNVFFKKVESSRCLSGSGFPA